MYEDAGAPRTWLYAPGHRPEVLDKAAGQQVDAVIADLEDAVPVVDRAAARAHVGRWLAQPDRGGGPARWVRVGASTLADDLAAVLGPGSDGPDGLVLAKAELPLVARLDALLSEAADAAGPRDLPVVALLETAAGILDARAIAAAPRVALLATGEADLAAELRLRPSPDDRELLALRSQVVLASSAAGLPGPMGPVCTTVRDQDVLRRAAEAAVAQGFRALAAIHPAQLPILRAALTPSEEEVARAQDVLAALDAAGGAAAVGPDGRMVDEAVARQAREVLRAARRPTAADEAG